jgi:hypothetical protein
MLECMTPLNYWRRFSKPLGPEEDIPGVRTVTNKRAKYEKKYLEQLVAWMDRGR